MRANHLESVAGLLLLALTACGGGGSAEADGRTLSSQETVAQEDFVTPGFDVGKPDEHRQVDADVLPDLVGPETEPPCQPPKPYEFQGMCVECLDSSQCNVGAMCQDGSHTCTPACDLECCYCQEPYPNCTQLNGVWWCVECTEDKDCSEGGTCDTALYACEDGAGEAHCVPCTDNSECVSTGGKFVLKCDQDIGCCYDVEGWCDGVEAACPAGGCRAMSEILDCGFGPQEEGSPACLWDLELKGICPCTDSMTLEEILQCASSGCPSTECPGDTVCVNIESAACFWPTKIPGSFCVDKGLIMQE